MKNNYIRLKDKSDRLVFGSKGIQTSGNIPLTGEARDIRDFSYHSYQIVPISVDGSEQSGGFNIEVSNDNINWTNYTGIEFTTSGDANIALSQNFHFTYARPYLTGQGSSHYVINESHLA